MGDMLVAWPIILASAGIALAMSFVYTIITQRCGCCLVMALVASIAIAGFVAGYAILDDLYSRKDEPILSAYTASSLKAQVGERRFATFKMSSTIVPGNSLLAYFFCVSYSPPSLP